MTTHTLLVFEIKTKAIKYVFLSAVTFLAEVASSSVLIDLIKLEDAHY